MLQEIVIDIPLEQIPNPEGDNRFEVKICEGETSLTYLSSKMINDALVNAGNVKILFSNCVASKYIGAEPEDELYPGWFDVESDFSEIGNSHWADTFSSQNVVFRHYLFCLNHQVFECIAESYSIHCASSEGTVNQAMQPTAKFVHFFRCRCAPISRKKRTNLAAADCGVIRQT